MTVLLGEKVFLQADVLWQLHVSRAQSPEAGNGAIGIFPMSRTEPPFPMRTPHAHRQGHGRIWAFPAIETQMLLDVTIQVESDDLERYVNLASMASMSFAEFASAKLKEATATDYVPFESEEEV